jgi:nucleoside-diphosphate-sugar epimerase
MNNSLKILIVGATGYIGKRIFERLFRLYTTYGTSTSGNNGTIKLNLLTPNDFNFNLIEKDDFVILTSAISEPDLCTKQITFTWQVNVKGTIEFINRVLDRGGRVIFFSSDVVYGNQEIVFDENQPCNPLGVYAEMKCEVEREFAQVNSFKSVRLSYVFSSEDKFTHYICCCAQQGKTVEIFQSFFRAIVYREDVVSGIHMLLESWNDFPERYINFGGPEILSRVQFVECLKNIAFCNLDYKVSEPPKEFFEQRPRFIAMKSPVFSKLLGRLPLTLSEAAFVEFKIHN